MIKQNNQLILKQGYKTILLTLGIGFLIDIFISDFLASVVYILVFVLLFIYRNPSRMALHENESDILSPIDGNVIAIDKTSDMHKVLINVSLCNSHVLRAPLKSKYDLLSFKNGLNLNSNSFKAKKLNAQARLKFDDITLEMISGTCNTSLDFIDNKDVKAGEEIGLFLQGLILVEIPFKYNLEINLNDNIYSNTSTLAKLA